MTGALRGPDGSAPFPPAWLDAIHLPIQTIEKGAPLYRVHARHLGPVFFGPGPGRPPTFRFDPASGAFGILYLAPGADAALVETLLRNPQRLTVDYREIERRSLSVLSAGRAMRLVRAYGEGLSTIGTTGGLSTGPYDACAQWSDALMRHPDAPDGILFGSRHNPDELCIALFEKPDLGLTVRETMPLVERLAEVGRLLDRHGKSVFGVP